MISISSRGIFPRTGLSADTDDARRNRLVIVRNYPALLLRRAPDTLGAKVFFRAAGAPGLGEKRDGPTLKYRFFVPPRHARIVRAFIAAGMRWLLLSFARMRRWIVQGRRAGKVNG